MIFRTKDVKKVVDAVSQYQEEVLGFEPDDWLKNHDNVALVKGDDVSLFERQYDLGDDVVCGHYFFFSRGRAARDTAKEMLKEAFTGPYNINRIAGLTPVDHRGALWMNKQLGFKSYGQVDTPAGPCEFVLLTKQEWENSQNE